MILANTGVKAINNITSYTRAKKTGTTVPVFL
jgi:hypothetical protein